MRNLVILRGSPGSGKSTWIKENHLEPYTLSPDTIRTMVSSPVLQENITHPVISQRNDIYVWDLLFQLLEKRMEHGDFTIIDATHSKQSDFSKYNKLCDLYRYRKYTVSFTDVPLEECKDRNRKRDSYKIVPDEVIEKMYSRFENQGALSGWKEIKKDEFWKTFENQIYDFNKYDKIHIFGDIHGCYQPLMKYILSSSELTVEDRVYSPGELSNYLNDNEFYLFTGDYIDRGLENKEVLQFLYNICKKDNVLMLQGNHEDSLYYYSLELDDKIRNRKFKSDTIPQIKDIPSTNLRGLYRKLAQLAYFNYNDNNYLVSHGGLNYIPQYLQVIVPTSQLLHGIGDFTYQIDEEFTKNSKNTIQIHGHRSREYPLDIDISKSISLEDKVEFGGNLVILELNKSGQKLHKIKNELFEEPKLLTISKPEPLTVEELVSNLRSNSNIRESILSDSISSFNFTRNAFENGKWDKETIRARGLFIDTKNNKIVARGYEKFFNINEQEKTRLFNLKFMFNKDTEVVAYKKYNGFLGILSYYNNELQFHSKSTNNGEHVQYFRDLFYKQFDKTQISMIEAYLRSYNYSMTFEVIDIENDPHIIEEEKSRIVLLDIIHNTLEFKKESYRILTSFAKTLGLRETQYKQIYTTFKSYRELTEFYQEHKDEQNFDDTDIEGVVIESNNFMTKLKFNYYTFWKSMRTITEMTFNGKPIRYSKLYNKLSNDYYKFIKDKYNNQCKVLEQIKEELEIENYPISKLRNCKISDSGIILDIPDKRLKTKISMRFRALFNKNKYYKAYKEKLFILNKDLLNKLQKIQNSKTDIITLRKEFYENQNINKEEN